MRSRSLRTLAGIAAAGFLVAGCAADGPRGDAIEHSAAVTPTARKPQNLPYCLVNLTPGVVKIALEHRPHLSGSLSRTGRGRDVRFGIGDVVGVTLFESAQGGLFFPAEGGIRQGNFINLPNQRVDNGGNITVPYAGQIKASGRTVVDVQNSIVEALKSRALDPQAVVTMIEQHADLITVVGDVGTPSRVPASASGERVLDVVSRAGGLRGPGQESWVMLDRGGSLQTVPFEALVREPENNIPVQAKDTLYVYREPQQFLAFGAVTKQGQIPFDAWRVTLSEAIGKAGGLIDVQAEPAWVFLYRLESRRVVDEIDPSCHVGNGNQVPVIYEANLRDPSGYFLTSQFPMRNKDLIYVANSRTVETTKMFTFVQDANLAAQGPLETGIFAYTLKQLAHGTGSTGVVVGTTSAVGQ